MSKNNWLEGIEQRVVEAYKATGLKPAGGVFFSKEKNCGCALGVLNLEVAKSVSESRRLKPWRGTSYYEAFRCSDGPVSGVEEAEQSAFAAGFDHGIWEDSWSPPSHASEARQAGYRTALAVKEAGLV